MQEAATNVGELRAKMPMVEDWGWFDVPRLISPFLSRLNGYTEEWAAAAATLERILKDDAPKLGSVAKKYRDAEADAGAASHSINQ